MTVNKSVVHAPFVNRPYRLSALQRAILAALVASDWARLPGALPIHWLRSVFGLPRSCPGRRGEVHLSGSQRASLSRSLVRLERAGHIERPGSSVQITTAGRRAIECR